MVKPQSEASQFPQGPAGDRSLHGLDAEVVAHKIDTLVRTANILLMRGQPGEAVTACQEALALEPEHPDVRELLGDILAKQGKQQAAIAEYRAVFQAHPDRISAERKIAELSLRVGEQLRLLDRQRQLVRNPTKRNGGVQRYRIALFSSLLLPGLGQLCLGAYVMGAALLGVAVALGYYILKKLLIEPLSAAGPANGGLAQALRELPAYVAAYPPFTKGAILVAFLLILAAYAYGLFDALRIAKAQQDRRDQDLGIA